MENVANTSALVPVSHDALRQVLMALNGPAHHITELQVTRRLHELMGDHPIEILIEDYNRWCAEQKGVA